jgi:hypothetical protein
MKKFNLINAQAIINNSKKEIKMVNLDDYSDFSGLLSALSKHIFRISKLCFKGGGSLVRLTIFKNFVQHI